MNCFRARCLGFTLLAGGVALLLSGQSAVAEERSQPINLSLFHPASTSPDPDVRTNFRLNLIYGHVREVRGVDLGGLVARTSGESAGLRFTFLTSVVGGDARGLSATGILDYVAGDVSGLQVAGLVAYDRGSFRGIQLAGLFGYVENKAVGIQISSVFNLADEAGRLFQIGSVGNVVGSDLVGFQLAGLNFVQGAVTGFQGGLLNFAESLHGFQIGGINNALTANGVQIGLVNFSEENTSVPIGAASFSTGSNTDWFTEGSTYVGILTGIRTSVHGWRASVGVGGIDVSRDDTDTFAAAWWWGREFGLGQRWLLAPDLGFVHVTARSSGAGEDEKRPAGQARVLLEFRPGARFAVYAGGGVSLNFTRYGSGADSETEALGVLGLSLF